MAQSISATRAYATVRRGSQCGGLPSAACVVVGLPSAAPQTLVDASGGGNPALDSNARYAQSVVTLNAEAPVEAYHLRTAFRASLAGRCLSARAGVGPDRRRCVWRRDLRGRSTAGGSGGGSGSGSGPGVDGPAGGAAAPPTPAATAAAAAAVETPDGRRPPRWRCFQDALTGEALAAATPAPDALAGPSPAASAAQLGYPASSAARLDATESRAAAHIRSQRYASARRASGILDVLRSEGDGGDDVSHARVYADQRHKCVLVKGEALTRRLVFHTRHRRLCSRRLPAPPRAAVGRLLHCFFRRLWEVSQKDEADAVRVHDRSEFRLARPHPRLAGESSKRGPPTAQTAVQTT